MRYDNWDIILFPEDSNIPIPEYKTACYFSRDEGEPTGLTAYATHTHTEELQSRN